MLIIGDKGNKENNNDSTIDETEKPSADLDQNANVNPSSNASMDTSFIIHNVNDHAAIQHQSSSDQHSEL